MSTESAYLTAKRLSGHIAQILSAIELQDLEQPMRTAVQRLKRDTSDVCLDIRDYELAETRAEQQSLRRTALRKLQAVEVQVLALSEYNIFSALDVVELSTKIDSLRGELV